MDVKRSASFIGQRLDAVSERLERDGWEADFSDIREKNKAYTPVFNNKTATPSVSGQENQTVQEQPKAQEQNEVVAARATEQPRFHR